jgi:hypothetical protein
MPRLAPVIHATLPVSLPEVVMLPPRSIPTGLYLWLRAANDTTRKTGAHDTIRSTARNQQLRPGARELEQSQAMTRPDGS